MRIELAMQATLLALCLGVFAAGALCYAGDTVRWIKRKLGERRERRAALRTRLEKWRGILS